MVPAGTRKLTVRLSSLPLAAMLRAAQTRPCPRSSTTSAVNGPLDSLSSRRRNSAGPAGDFTVWNELLRSAGVNVNIARLGCGRFFCPGVGCGLISAGRVELVRSGADGLGIAAGSGDTVGPGVGRPITELA